MKALKRKLDALIPTMKEMSPVQSPSIEEASYSPILEPEDLEDDNTPEAPGTVTPPLIETKSDENQQMEELAKDILGIANIGKNQNYVHLNNYA